MDEIGPEHGAKIVATHRGSIDAFARADLDGVIIATPDHLHAETALAAIEAGLHVYSASPMARTGQEAAAVRDAMRNSDRIYQAGVDLVFEPRWHAARSLVQSGVIGDVRWCSGTTYMHTWDLDCSGGWKTNPQCTHGPAAHRLVDLWAVCAFMTGAKDALSVSSVGGSFQSKDPLPDAFNLSADFDHGVHFNLDCHPSRYSTPHAIIRGSTASLIIERECIVGMPEAIGDGKVYELWRTDGSPAPTALEEWLTCIRTGDRCTCNAEMGYQASSAIARAMDGYRSNVSSS
jgi:predicted dehydrogenase